MRGINVSPYPNDKGKLYRSIEGIIYVVLDFKVIAMGCDLKNVGVISPLGSSGLKLLVNKAVPTDDSLARQQKTAGGLLASEIIVTSKSIRLPISQPISLFKTVSNYIIKNQESEKFNLKLLPQKLKMGINSHIELDKMWTKLCETMKQKDESIALLTKQHYQDLKELHVRHENEILNLQSRQEQEKLDNSTNQKEDGMLNRIRELECLILS